MELSNRSLYKVIAGSFKSERNAEGRVVFLLSKGIQSFIKPTTISGSIWFQVQAEAFSNKQNAERILDKLKQSGIEDAYITFRE